METTERLTAPYDERGPQGVRPFRWPGGSALAVAVVVVLEVMEPEHPHGWPQPRDVAGGRGLRPAPDYTLLSHREYGHRVGVFRVIDALEEAGMPVSLAVDALTAEHYPRLMELALQRHADVLAHGLSASRMISSAMTEDEERAYIDASLARLASATGLAPTGWLGVHQGESPRTPRLLAECGLRYLCDWNDDERLSALPVPSGSLYSLPTMLSYDDAHALWFRAMAPADYAEMVGTGVERLLDEPDDPRRVLVFCVRPWLMGQPFRIGYLREALGRIAAQAGVWAASPSAVVDAYVNAQQGGGLA